MSRPYIPVAVRTLVTNRATGRCEYCLCPVAYSSDPFAMEHICPFALGGVSDESNLALACDGCNSRKQIATRALDPLTLEIVSLFHPRRDRWAEHFAWGTDELSLVGLTATGRATIERLELNRTGVINVRRLLRLVGEHPPEHTPGR